MSSVSILVGSVLGASEYVADALADLVKKAGIEVNVHYQPTLEDAQSDYWIICTSTHGAGDFPDNILPFVKQIEDADLTSKKVMIVGLGDSSYDTFCAAAVKMETLLTTANAQLIAPPLHIDVLHHPIPEDFAVDWLSQHLSLITD